MRFTPRTWSLLSLLLFVAAAFFWLKGNEYEEARRSKKILPAVLRTNTHSRFDPLSTRGKQLARLSVPQTLSAGAVTNGVAPEDQFERLYPHRLRNTRLSLAELIRRDHAILLANALIDTDSLEPVKIPRHLRADGDPGSYIVQWTGPATPEFRAKLAEAGARIVSYVPNNAYFVALDGQGARKLSATPGIQRVLPFEPYYKLERSLLAAAVDEDLLPPNTLLRLTLLPGTRETAARDLATLGAAVLAEEPSPFGPQLIVRPPADSLAALARLSAVQGIEPQSPRVPASDLSRMILGIATNGFTNNYLRLTGSNIWVNINDTGIETNHPALRNTTISLSEVPMNGTDPDGHGTFVAGLIAGDGAQSPGSTNAPPGSETNAIFRGVAPAAKLLALPLDAGGRGVYPEVNEKLSDNWLIDRAARTNYLALKRTNSLISNNSWTYGRAEYDSAAARFDAAARDAIPGETGPQPLLFVFAAGNSGFGDEDGGGGVIGRIESPGSAKNVITVGALESPRLMTNVFYTLTNIFYTTNTDGTIETNEQATDVFPFIGLTDSSNQVASFSSRGNVGIGTEGPFGRFKPDVVAPGAMLVSARSSGWDFNGLDTNDAQFGQLLFNLHTNLQPYRFGNGTTFAAANVSGMLALIQEYFERLAPVAARGPLSPALMKALLINGARSLTEFYDIALQNAANFQGWGLPNLPNSLTSYSTNSHDSIPNPKWRLRYVEQNPDHAVATGQSRTWNVTLSTNASLFPLRVTLVWTDPPGNPAVALKLVNDLDLIVTNRESGTVFYGNNFMLGSDFTQGVTPLPGQAAPVDRVNNVENVFIQNPKQFGREFSITVRGRRVNVNAISDFNAFSSSPNDVVQDYALVISTEMGADPSLNFDDGVDRLYFPDEDAFESFVEPTRSDTEPRSPLTVITNGLPLLTERIGANPSLLGPNGSTNQWNFYVFTNVTITNALVNIQAGTNVAFVTFDSPNLSRPRDSEADIDLYVSIDPGLTNLTPAALAGAWRSVERGGTETVVISNAVIGDVYYIGVKSEDQQASEFSLVGISTDLPLDQDRNGKRQLVALPISAEVLDGTAARPTAATLIAIGLNNQRVARVVVTNTIAHQNIGDLVGVLSHRGVRTVLNNHIITNTPSGTNILVYDDFQMVSPPWIPGMPFPRPSDGPGTLNDFAGQKIIGPWILQMIDNAPSHTGRVELVTLTIDPLRPGLLSGVFFTETLPGNQVSFFPIDIPAGVTNLIFRFTDVSAGPLDVLLRKDLLPTTNEFDFRTNVLAPGRVFSFPTTNSAPLTPGTYFLAVRNPNAFAITYTLQVLFELGRDPANFFSRFGNDPGVLDDAATNDVIDLAADKLVAGVEVAVNLPHPRIADTVLSLVSPQGTRVVLAENRGRGTRAGFGGSYSLTQGTNIVGTNLAYTIFTEDTNITQTPIKFALPPFNAISTNLGVVFTNGFEGATNGTYSAGQVDGWQIVTPSVRVVAGGADTGTNFLALGTGRIRRTLPTVAGQSYTLSFAYKTQGADYIYWGEANGARLNRLEPGKTNIQTVLTFSGEGAIEGIDFDVPNGHLYAGNGRRLFRADLNGSNLVTVIPAGSHIWDVEVGKDWVYFAEAPSSFNSSVPANRIRRVRKDGSSPEVLLNINLLGIISGIAVDEANGKVYYIKGLNTGPDSIEVIDLRNNNRTNLVTLIPNDPTLNGVVDIDLDAAAGTLYFQGTGSREINRVSANGGPITAIFRPPLNLAPGIAVDTRFKRIFYVAINSSTINSILSIDWNGANPGIVASGASLVGYPGLAHDVPIAGASNAFAYVVFNGQTNGFTASPSWRTHEMRFVAQQNNQVLEFRPGEGEFYIDSITLEATGDEFVLPEEPLSILDGERAIGEWRLELRDVRTGQFLPLGGSAAWRLDLNLADPVVFAEPVTGGSFFGPGSRSLVNPTNRVAPGTLYTNQVHYFAVLPCTNATSLAVIVSGFGNFDAIELLADHSGIPTGDPETDDFVIMRNDRPFGSDGFASFELSPTLPAPARLRGKPLFLALRNRFGDQTNSYSLELFANGTCPATQPLALLAANQAVRGGLPGAAVAAGQGNAFRVNVAPGAKSIRFSVESGADVMILAQQGSPPTRESFSHIQNIPGSGSETLEINEASSVPLTPGVWYVRVVNNSSEANLYSLAASGDIADPSAPRLQAVWSAGQLRIEWNSTPGMGYEVESSTDLRNWATVATLAADAETTFFAPPYLSDEHRFYRVVAHP